jgi:signal transduction histidine kinase/CheY-like chemotaxis protein
MGQDNLLGGQRLSARTIGLNSFTLIFHDPANEDAFRDHYGIRSLPQARLYFFIGILLFSLFGIHDYLMHENSTIVLVLRFCIVFPSLIFITLLSYLPSFQKRIDVMVALGVFITGIGIIAIKIYSDNPIAHVNYSGVSLVVLFMFALLPVIFSHAFVAGISLVLVWTIAVLFISPMPRDLFISNMFYIYSSTLLGIFAGHVREFYARKTFYLMNRTIEEQLNVIRINQELEQKITERTEVLNIVNQHLHDEIRDKIRTEKELVRAKQKAEESDKMKSAFLANMSHEIRTPMNGILGFAHLLNSPTINEEKRYKFVSIINDNGKLLLKIIDDILDFAKIEAGELKIEKTRCNVDEMLQRLHATYNVNKVFRRKDKIDIRIVAQADQNPLIIDTDAKRLEQVISNMLDNALKFTEEGFIEFGYQVIQSEVVTFHVKDTGIGISKKFEKLVFERFNQAEIATRKYGGSGLGLAISKGIIELLGGRIGVESEAGNGTTFYFSLPLQQTIADKPSDLIVPGIAIDYSWKDKVLLVAEDEEINYNLIREILRDTQIKVIHARNGKEALDLLYTQKRKIDVILMDIKMPEMNGYEAIEKIRKEDRNIPIIAHTAFAMTDEKEKCMRLGCNDYITKPFNADDFLERLGKYLN